MTHDVGLGDVVTAIPVQASQGPPPPPEGPAQSNAIPLLTSDLRVRPSTGRGTPHEADWQGLKDVGLAKCLHNQRLNRRPLTWDPPPPRARKHGPVQPRSGR